MSDPLVTVIILTYNDLPHVHRAIESVLFQTFRNLKIKILDNGSTDNTWSELQKYAYDPRVVLLRNAKNQRSEFAAYEALRTDTEYLSVLFADDYYLPDRIAVGLKAFRERPDTEAVFVNVEAVDEFGNAVQGPRRTCFEGDISLMSQHEHLRHCFFHGPSLHPCAMLVKAKTYIQLGGFKPYFHRMGDLIFFARLLANAKAVFLQDKMQRVTVWSNGRNDSAGNAGDPPALLYERAMFLEEYLSPKMMEQYVDIFEQGRGGIALRNQAERLWYIGHQALETMAFDFRLFGFRCLYRAAEIADAEFYHNVAMVTGQTVPQYLASLAADPTCVSAATVGQFRSDLNLVYSDLRSLERWSLKGMTKRAVKKIPFSRPVYRYLRRLLQHPSQILRWKATP